MSDAWQFCAMSLGLFLEGCGFIGDGAFVDGFAALVFALLAVIAALSPTPASRMEARHG